MCLASSWAPILILLQHINKINKQNFDLKLEIFHRRQKCETLEARVSKLEGLEVDNEDLRAQNDELVLKLEKCDADLGMREDAIEEAVGMICELEAQIGDHEQDLARYRSIVDAGVGPPPGHAQMEPSTRITLEAKSALEDEHSPSHPRQEAIKRVASTSSILKSPLRPPSFLHDDRKSNTALRSLYSSRNPSIASFNRASSVLSDGELEEELERQMLSSPRLSILSESGFSSIYGHKRDKSTSPSVEPASPSDETFIAPNSSNEERHAQRKARISHWVEESRRQEAPKTPVHKPSRQASNARFSSIGELLEKTPGARSQQTEILASSPSQKSGSNSVRQGSDKSSSDSRSPTKSLRKSAKAHEKLSQHGSSNSVFSNNHLPPTPETMSTATIGRNSSTPSIVTEKSLAEGSSVPVNNYTRPTSSDSRKVSHFGRRPSTRDRDHDALDEDLQSTQAEQGGPRMGGDPAAFMNGSVKATRFFGSEVPRRPALNTHVTDMMFNGDGYSPKHASRNASYPAVAQVTERTPSAASPTSRRSSAIARDKITTSPRKAQSSAENQTFTNPSPTSLAIGNHPNVDTKSKSAASSLRFRLPHRVASSNNVQSVTSRIFKRNRPATVDEDPETQEAPLPQPPSRPRLGRPSSMHGQRPHFTEFQCTTPPLKSILPEGMLI